MAPGTQLSMTEDGRLAVTKQAPAGAGAERLRREAAILRRAAGPGVVELLSLADLDGGAVLQTAFVGGGTLAEQLGPSDQGPAPEATSADAIRGAKLAATVAATLADLHGRGIAHQRVTADHVLVTDIDQVRLCGLADATMTPEPGPCNPDAAAADVMAVASLVVDIAATATRSGVGALRAVADRVLLADPSARPSMRTLAQALGALTDEGAVPVPPRAQGRKLLPVRPSPTSRRRGPGGGRATMVLGAVALLALVTVVAVTTTTRPGPPPPVAAPSSTPQSLALDQSTTTTSSSAPRSTTSVPPVRVWPPEREPVAEGASDDCPPTASPALAATVDTDGDGCPEMVEVAQGVVSVSGQRWQVAPPDDLVAVGDWDCDGVSTPAVVQPATGAVWTFPRWAKGDEEVVASAETVTAPGAVSAAAVPAAPEGQVPQCHALALTDATGTTTRLHLNARRD